jgi:hypothetical protein
MCFFLLRSKGEGRAESEHPGFIWMHIFEPNNDRTILLNDFLVEK